ncbi:MAG: hypothetical protein IPL47_15275 [Phyllobacteriaceae bacterium]|nr:hypothetical protein [Phyllobacteriaceae bacterium]
MARGQELIADRDLERSEFGADWCGRTDIFHMIGGVQLVEGDIVVASGIHRPRSEEAFDLDERQAYALVLEHLGRAFRIAMRLGLLRGREAVSLDVIERLETGILLIRCDGELVFANPIAEKLLRANRWFSCRHKRIKPIYADDADRFAAEIASAGAAAASDNHGAPFAVRDPIEGALLLQILPFRPSAPIADASGACAVVMFRDPDRRKAIWPDSLVQAFGLTRAEARLVARLQEEESLTAAAATLGVSEATARTQLKSVFAKTGFRRQGELFGAIGANPLFRR